MGEPQTFRPGMFIRIWHVLVSIFLVWTCALAPVAIWLVGNALFKKVTVTETSIHKGPLGGAIAFADAKRWGRYSYEKNRNERGVSAVTYRYVVVQDTAGKQLTICLNDYSDGSAIEQAVAARLGPSTGRPEWRWTTGPRFAE